jgi:hypothetical protein
MDRQIHAGIRRLGGVCLLFDVVEQPGVRGWLVVGLGRAREGHVGP